MDLQLIKFVLKLNVHCRIYDPLLKELPLI